jgi:hypothetical protein
LRVLLDPRTPGGGLRNGPERCTPTHRQAGADHRHHGPYRLRGNQASRDYLYENERYPDRQRALQAKISAHRWWRPVVALHQVPLDPVQPGDCGHSRVVTPRRIPWPAAPRVVYRYFSYQSSSDPAYDGPRCHDHVATYLEVAPTPAELEHGGPPGPSGAAGRFWSDLPRSKEEPP